MRLVAAVVALLILSAFLLLSVASADAQAIDTGYRPWNNGFSFQNAGDPEAFYGIDLNAMTGTDFHDEIFRHTGHCFGMAQASIDDFLANRTSITEPYEEAMPRIDRIQTEQSFYYIADYCRPQLGSPAPDVRAEYRKILDRLSSGRPAVIGVYYSGGGHPGHAVVAYRADLDGNRTLVSVYDPNLPPALYDYRETPAEAVFDLHNGTFQYDNGEPFDQVRLDDISHAGVVAGQVITAGLASLPAAALLIMAALRFPPRP